MSGKTEVGRVSPLTAARRTHACTARRQYGRARHSVPAVWNGRDIALSRFAGSDSAATVDATGAD